MRTGDWSEHPEIARLFDAWSAAVRARDVEAVLELIEPDGEFWSNGAPAVQGREAMRARLGPFYEQYHFEQAFELLELIVRDDLAVARGMEQNWLTPIAGGDTVFIVQRAISIMRRQADGRWLFSRGMTNLPPKSQD